MAISLASGQDTPASDELKEQLHLKLVEARSYIRQDGEQTDWEAVVQKYRDFLDLVVATMPTRQQKVDPLFGRIHVGNVVQRAAETYLQHIGSPERTIEFCEFVVENFPYDLASVQALNFMGQAYEELGLDAKAIESYERLIDCDPEGSGKGLAQGGMALQAANEIARIYEPHEKALEWYKKIAEATRNYDIHASTRAEERIALIEDYSDCNQEPLELYLEIEAVQESFSRGVRSSREKLKELELLHLRLLRLYPDCKLAPFVQFLLAKHYAGLIGHVYSYISSELARDLSIESYRVIRERYPDSTFPLSRHLMCSRMKRGLPMAPIAEISIAWLLNSSGHVARKADQALEQLQSVIDNYPEAEDTEGDRLVADAYVGMLNIYTGWGQSSQEDYRTNIEGARRICNILINELPNQRYEVEETYFGDTHPTAYMRLAEVETDPDKAIALHKKVIFEYPNTWTGMSGSGKIRPYSVDALNKLTKLLYDPYLSIEACREIVNSELHRNIRGYAQFKIAEIYRSKLEDYEKAEIEYRKVLKDYEDVHLDGEPWTLGDSVRASRKRMERGE